jgi:glutathione S-transferase
MIRVHHLNNSRSQRVLWLLEEIDTPYEVVPYERDKKTMLAPKELRRVHPLGKSPIIEDNGRIFAETGLIVEYLVQRYGPGFGAAKRFGFILALQILAALCRRLAYATAAAQARDQQARAFGTAGQTVRQHSAKTSSRLLGR